MELPNRATKDPYQEIPVKDFSYINTQNKSPKKSHRWLVISSGLIILVLLGVGAFVYGHYTKDNKSESSKKSGTHKIVVQNKSSSSSKSTTTYPSATFGMTINHPANWTVSTGSNNSLSITSPETMLTSDTKKSVYGKIVFNVFNQGQIPTGFGSGSLAVLNSQDINFSNPTTSQAAQTYISFVQYPSTNVTGGMDAIFVTGNNGYVKDQSITTTQVNQVSPLIIIDFEQCKTKACTSLTSLTISSSMWSDSSFATPITNMLESLTFS